jgi:hypothetical protein
MGESFPRNNGDSAYRYPRSRLQVKKINDSSVLSPDGDGVVISLSGSGYTVVTTEVGPTLLSVDVDEVGVESGL